ncbi:hypothetical protein [Deinococcus geothermalis]|uniref:hypothetical protein n=1 Tax=Deinococcus geothermalis TaxID=68909 RepID=UPI002352F696
MKTLPVPSEAQLLREAARRELLRAQFMARMGGETAPTSPVPARHRDTAPRLLSREDMLRGLGLHRRSVRAQPVLAHYEPPHVRTPVIFRWKPGQRLSKLARPVSAAWTQVLTSISTTSLAGGRLSGAQGRNLIAIVEELRKRCYLRVSGMGQPVQVREQVVLVVDGSEHCFARACGMSVATFYRALHHPLAHCFIRTQKVQRADAGRETRRNVGTLFTVAMFEPDLPAELDEAFYAEPVEEPGVFVVPDSPSQFERTKERPLETQKPKGIVENSGANTKGLSFPAAPVATHVQAWLDAAPLGTKGAGGVDAHGPDLKGCLDRLRMVRPDLWELAVQIAIHHDAPQTHAVAAVGYYKALIHLGVGAVRRCVQAVERYRMQGQTITNPGAVLMSHLNREARRVTGYNIRDLGTEKDQVLA